MIKFCLKALIVSVVGAVVVVVANILTGYKVVGGNDVITLHDIAFILVGYGIYWVAED